MVEVTHLVFFPDNVIGSEYNHFGPRISRLPLYLREKVPTNEDVKNLRLSRKFRYSVPSFNLACNRQFIYESRLKKAGYPVTISAIFGKGWSCVVVSLLQSCEENSAARLQGHDGLNPLYW